MFMFICINGDNKIQNLFLYYDWQVVERTEIEPQPHMQRLTGVIIPSQTNILIPASLSLEGILGARGRGTQG